MAADERPNSVTRVAAQPIRHGTDVRANRAFPTDAHPGHVDPFVLFERFDIDPDTGFPMHPHRGFEIVSYMLDGGMEHTDSLDVEHVAEQSAATERASGGAASSVAREGDAMRITTGRGIRHSEFPADGAGCEGLQLWVNLPRDAKDAEPDYADASAADLPTETVDGATVTTVVGDGSPLSLHTEMTYRDARVDGAWTHAPPAEWTGFLFGVAGTGTVDGDAFGEGDVLLTDGDDVRVESDDGLRVVAVAGRPHGDPIDQRGPFVF
ncbi:MAG: pirin family protein [Halarchaeum sp.]